MFAPPVSVGGSQLADAVNGLPAAPAVDACITGAPGVVAGVTVGDSGEKLPNPIAFCARTRNRYTVPFVRPVMTCVVVVAGNGGRSGWITPPALSSTR